MRVLALRIIGPDERPPSAPRTGATAGRADRGAPALRGLPARTRGAPQARISRPLGGERGSSTALERPATSSYPSKQEIGTARRTHTSDTARRHRGGPDLLGVVVVLARHARVAARATRRKPAGEKRTTREATGASRVVNVRARASLYQTIDRLQRHGLVEVSQTTRLDGYPDRVVYAITDAGRQVARQWLREMLRGTEGEYPSSSRPCRSCSGSSRRRRRPNSSCGPRSSQPRSLRPSQC